MNSIHTDVIHCIAGLQSFCTLFSGAQISHSSIFGHIHLPYDNMDQLLHMLCLQTCAFALEFSEPCLSRVHLVTNPRKISCSTRIFLNPNNIPHFMTYHKLHQPVWRIYHALYRRLNTCGYNYILHYQSNVQTPRLSCWSVQLHALTWGWCGESEYYTIIE